MSTTEPTAMQFSHRRALKAGFASFVGTSIEFYDFYIYATAAALVFGPLFFPEADPVMGVLFSFATYAVGFFFRPLGGIIFGYVGDKFGRRRSLVITLVLMGAGTTLVGFLPTYESIGIMAPILLVLLRVVQGVAVGGEWGGAVLMAVENAPDRFKGFYGSFPQLGNPMGALMASGMFLLLTLDDESTFLLDWGWRIPFILSAVLIAVGFWVRYTVEETPVFEQEMAQTQAQMTPIRTAIIQNWKSILLGVGLIPISTGGYYIVTTFATAYGTEDAFGIGVSEHDFLTILTIAAFAELVSTLFIGTAADRVGRKRAMGLSLVLTSIFVIPMFLTMSPDNFVIMVILFSLVRVLMNGTWAPMAHCRVESTWVARSRPGLTNHALSAALYANLEQVGAPQYGAEAIVSAQEIQQGLGLVPMERPYLDECEALITPQEAETGLREQMPAWQHNWTSDDYVEMTHYAPTVRFYVSRPALKPAPGMGAYPAWVMNALGGIPAAIDPTIEVAGKTVAGTFVDLLLTPELREQAWNEFVERSQAVGTPPLLPPDFVPPTQLPWPEYVRDHSGARHWLTAGPWG